CSAENIETALKISLKGLGTSKNIELQTSVQPNSCHTVKEGPKFTLGAGVYW
ncbi:hypothetical protein EAI_00041, partial [Harpegnathos saltator]